MHSEFWARPWASGSAWVAPLESPSVPDSVCSCCACCRLPVEIERYLIRLVIQIAEEKAWERGSHLYHFLAKACQHLAPAASSGGAQAAVTRGASVSQSEGTPGAAAPGESSGAAAAAGAGGGSQCHTDQDGSRAEGHGRQQAEIAWIPSACWACCCAAACLAACRDAPCWCCAGALEEDPPEAAAGTKADAEGEITSSPHQGAAAGNTGAAASTAGGAGARAVVVEFFQQVLKVARERIWQLCERMDFDGRDQRELAKAASLEIVEAALYRRTKLFYNRQVYGPSCSSAGPRRVLLLLLLPLLLLLSVAVWRVLDRKAMHVGSLEGHQGHGPLLRKWPALYISNLPGCPCSCPPRRHLDQVVLCSVYGVCKVLQMREQKFKDIVSRYQKQPQASPSIFRHVVIQQSMPGLVVESKKDIIEFYNQAG